MSLMADPSMRQTMMLASSDHDDTYKKNKADNEVGSSDKDDTNNIKEVEKT